jgi:transcriptional regulator with XRE-family HTH domain
MTFDGMARGDLLEGLAERLRAERLALGWTLKQAEEASGIDNSHISQIEHLRIKGPAWHVVRALEIAYSTARKQREEGQAHD